MSAVTTTPITDPTRGANGTRTISEAQKGLNANYADFLKLLTTQLTNQDPTEPLDTNQITQQIASLSQVEQQINTNTNLQKLVNMFSATQTNTAVSFIGKQVDAIGNKTLLTAAKAPLVYSVPAGTQTAKVTITNSAGQMVFTGPGTTIAGRNQVLWNGINSISGETMPDGAYTFKVEAKDEAGKALTATTYTTGVVSAVDMQDGQTSLSLGRNVSVPLDTILKIYTAGANPEA